MSVFCQLKQLLIQQLAAQALDADWQMLSACVEIEEREEESADGLSWLKGQKVFPQYYWQHRDQHTLYIALGAALIFPDLTQAEQFVRQKHTTIVGGIEFEGREVFILPRLLFVKTSGLLTAYCHLNGAEKSDVLAFLAQLAPPQGLDNQPHQLRHKTSVYRFERWAENIQKAIQMMQVEAFDKVVLANATTLEFAEPVSAYDLLSASRMKNRGCFHFLWAERADAIFIGSSPERLYQRQGRHFLTEALAGTVAVSDDPIQTEQNALWLLNDHKNTYENWLVVDDICTHLADCTSDIQVSEAEIKRLSNVQHLRRKIRTMLLETVSDVDCLQRIHPTAAVAGLPRSAAKQFIQEHEGFKRGWYAGALGYIQPEQAEFCVMLRSALIERHRITIYAGAGIVAESDPHSEWQEIGRKSQAMLGLLT